MDYITLYTAEESVLATPLWGMLYADDAGVVSQSPGQLRKIVEIGLKPGDREMVVD